MPDTPIALPDVNVLVALTNPAHVHHGRAHQWLAGMTTFATTPITEAGLVRLLMNPAVVGQVVTGAQALDLLHQLRTDKRAVFLPDESSLAEASVDTIGLTGYRQVTDLHLVSLAAEKGAQLTTFDRRIPDMLVAADRHHVLVLQ